MKALHPNANQCPEVLLEGIGLFFVSFFFGVLGRGGGLGKGFTCMQSDPCYHIAGRLCPLEKDLTNINS